MWRGRQSGFTLLELLAALVVLGLLMVAITQGVRFGVQAWQTQARTVDTQGDLLAVDRTLRGMIERADPGGFLQRLPAFAGNARSLSLTTVLGFPSADAPAQQVDVMLRTDDAHRLLLLWLPHYSDPIGAARIPERSVLLEGIDHIQISYWQAPTGNNRSGWFSAWNGPDLPRLIRIHIAFPEGDTRHLPDIVAAPMRDRWQL